MARGSKFWFRKLRNSTIHVAKTKALISCAVTAQLICAFVFVPRLFEEKRRDIVFGFPSFRPSVCPSFHPPIEYVPCVRNSSYTFTQVLLKLYRCFYHPLKICMWFGYNPQINFSHFFRNLNSHFSSILTIKVNGQWIPCVRNSS